MDIYQEGTKIPGAAHLISDASISVDRVFDNKDGSPTAPHMSDLLYVHDMRTSQNATVASRGSRLRRESHDSC